MTAHPVTIGKSRAEDAGALADIFAESWREAYRGILPHLELEHMIARRGANWWTKASADGGLITARFDGALVGYASHGPSRRSFRQHRGEIYELYVRPVYQGVGLGGRLFAEARRSLAARRLDGLVVWSLKENERACAFYQSLGGQPMAETVEPYGEEKVGKIAFGWPSKARI